MSNEGQTEDQAPPEGSGRLDQWRRSVVVAELGLIDAASGLLERLRNRVGPSSGKEGVAEGGKGRARAQPDQTAGAEVTAPPKPKRLVYALAFMLTLALGAAAGGGYSYRMLSKANAGSSQVLDKLREDLEDMKKQDAANRKELANRQNTINSYDKGIVRYLKEIEDYKTETEELRSQLADAKNLGRSTRRTSMGEENRERRDGRSSPGTTALPRPARPQTTGDCVMDPANVAASLEKCVGEFNRK